MNAGVTPGVGAGWQHTLQCHNVTPAFIAGVQGPKHDSADKNLRGPYPIVRPITPIQFSSAILRTSVSP